MPAGIPVATVAVGNARNAGLLAVRILATADDDAARRDGRSYQADLARHDRARRTPTVRAALLADPGYAVAPTRWRWRRRMSSLAARRAGKHRGDDADERGDHHDDHELAGRGRELGEAFAPSRASTTRPAEEQADHEAEQRAEQRDDHRLPAHRRPHLRPASCRPRGAARARACARRSTAPACSRCR